MTEETTNEPAEPRTITIPESKRGVRFPMADPVVGLLQRDNGVLHRLPAEADRITIGSSPTCDIRIDRPFISRVHCTIVRDGSSLRVQDADSHNGTFVDDKPVADDVLVAGSKLILAGHDGAQLITMTRLMIAALPTLRLLAGHRPDSAVNHLLPSAVGANNIALLAGSGSLVERLIDTIHRISHRRAATLQIFEQLPKKLEDQRALIEACRGGTLALIPADEVTAIDELARAMIFDPHRDVRLIIAMASMEDVVRTVGVSAFSAMQVIPIPALSQRRDEVTTLIDACLEELTAPIRLADLTSSNAEALRGHSWDRLEEIRHAARWIDAIARAGSIRKAAPLLGVPRTTLQGWLTSIGLRIPLL